MLRRFQVAIIALTALSIVYTLAMTYLAHKTYPYGLPWFSGDRWQDFWVFQERFVHFRQPSFWAMHSYPMTYPAPIGIAFALLYELPHPMGVYLCLFFTALAVGAWFFVRSMVALGVSSSAAIGFTAAVVLTSWPLAYMLNRANIEGLVVILLGGGMLALARHRWMWAATLIGIAGAMKIFPLALLGVLLARRRYLEFAGGLVVSAVAVIGSLALLGPDVRIAQSHINEGLLFFQTTFATAVVPTWIGCDHSLFTWVKLGVVSLHGLFTHRIVVHQADGTHGHLVAASSALLLQSERIYMITVTLLGLALFAFRIRVLPMLNQLLALTICAVVLPPVSFDYTLLHLLVPVALLCLYLVQAHRDGVPVQGAGVAMACLAVAFTAGMYFSLVFRFAGQVRTAALIGLLVLVCRFPYRWSTLDSTVT